MGLLPAYDRIGWWAPVLLIVLRLAQGLAAGGEWGGGVPLLAHPREGLAAEIVADCQRRRCSP